MADELEAPTENASETTTLTLDEEDIKWIKNMRLNHLTTNPSADNSTTSESTESVAILKVETPLPTETPASNEATKRSRRIKRLKFTKSV